MTHCQLPRYSCPKPRSHPSSLFLPLILLNNQCLSKFFNIDLKATHLSLSPQDCRASSWQHSPLTFSRSLTLLSLPLLVLQATVLTAARLILLKCQQEHFTLCLKASDISQYVWNESKCLPMGSRATEAESYLRIWAHLLLVLSFAWSSPTDLLPVLRTYEA